MEKSNVYYIVLLSYHMVGDYTLVSYCSLNEHFIGFQIVASRTIATQKFYKTQPRSKALDQTLLSRSSDGH